MFNSSEQEVELPDFPLYLTCNLFSLQVCYLQNDCQFLHCFSLASAIISWLFSSVWILDLFLCPLLNEPLLPPLVPHQQAPHSFFLYSCQLMHYHTVSLQLSVTPGDYTLLGLSGILDVFTFLMATTEDI